MGEGMETTQERLLGILYRFDCPAPLAIGEYAMDILEEPERAEVAIHVLECALCAAELNASRAFLTTDLRPVA